MCVFLYVFMHVCIHVCICLCREVYSKKLTFFVLWCQHIDEAQQECREDETGGWERQATGCCVDNDSLDVVGIAVYLGSPAVLVHQLLVVRAGGAVLLDHQVLQARAGGQGVLRPLGGGHAWLLWGGHVVTFFLPALVGRSVSSGGHLTLVPVLGVDCVVRGSGQPGRADRALGNGGLVAVDSGALHSLPSEALTGPGAGSRLGRLGLTFLHLLLLLLSQQFFKSALAVHLLHPLLLFLEHLLVVLFLKLLAGHDAIHTAHGSFGGHRVLGGWGPRFRFRPVYRWWVYLHPAISCRNEDIARVLSSAWVTGRQGGAEHVLYCCGNHIGLVILTHDLLCGPVNMGLALCLGLKTQIHTGSASACTTNICDATQNSLNLSKNKKSKSNCYVHHTYLKHYIKTHSFIYTIQ